MRKVEFITGKFDTHEDLLAFIISSHEEHGSTCRIAREAKITESCVRIVKRRYLMALTEPRPCWRCGVPPTLEPIKGSLLYQCQECGDCAAPADNNTQALQNWNLTHGRHYRPRN